jgi:hypothetical protein
MIVVIPYVRQCATSGMFHRLIPRGALDRLSLASTERAREVIKVSDGRDNEER